MQLQQTGTSSNAAHIEGQRLYFLVVSCSEVPRGLHEQLVVEANRTHFCKNGEIGFMHKTPHPSPDLGAVSAPAFEAADRGEPLADLYKALGEEICQGLYAMVEELTKLKLPRHAKRRISQSATPLEQCFATFPERARHR